MSIVTAVAVVTVIGLLGAAILVVAAHFMHVEEDPRVGEVLGVLPGANCGACGYPTCREKAIAVFQGRADVRMCLPYMRERAESTSNLIIEYAPNAILLLSPEDTVLEYNKQAMSMLGIRGRSAQGRPVADYLEGGLPHLAQDAPTDALCRVAGRENQVRLSAVRMPGGDAIVLLRDVTREEQSRSEFEKMRAETLRMAQAAADRQIHMVQEVARQLGETAGETKAALLRMERAMRQGGGDK